VLSVARDITERKRAEQALTHSRDLMRYIIEHNRSAVAVHDRDLKYLFVSQRYLQDYKVKERDVIGKHHYDVFPDLPQKWRAVHQKALAGEISSAEDDPYVRQDGTVDWTRWECRPWHEADGSIGGIVVYTEVITERKRAEAALRESEARKAAVLEAAPDCIVAVDSSGNITEFNPAAERTFGHRREDVIGKTMMPILIPPALREAHSAGVMRFKATGQSTYLGRPMERVAMRADGTEFPVELAVVPLTAPGVTGFVGVIHDITERKRLQAQFLQAQKMESVGRLAAGVAHDFNNLLSVILGWTGIALEDLPAEHPIRPSLEAVLSAGQGAAKLTRQLLSFSRQQLVQPTLFNVNDLVVEMDNMLRRLIREDIELVIRTDPELGAVKMDRGQLEQVLMNLMVNARDAMPQAGMLTIETANIVLDAAHPQRDADMAPGEYVMVTVNDSGTGMSEEVKTHLFEPFFTTKAPGTGTGLGLATSYGIVKQAGGHIVVCSEEGVGTTMKIYLPRSGEAGEEAVRSRKRIPGHGVETILLVEDEPAVRRVTARMLEMLGYRVVSTASGKEALRVIEDSREPFHLLLTDVVLMGGMSGPVLAARVRALRPEQKVLFVSGYTSDVTILHGLLEQRIALVQKPFTAESLGEKVRQVLDASGTSGPVMENG
jgi:PAS domain S-box-containing protein